MRKDIEIHINTGDLAFTHGDTPVTYEFQWVNNPGSLTRYIYGEIIVPSTLSVKHIMDKGLNVTIPYTPVYKEFYIRIKRQLDAENYSYVQNPVDGSDWFLVQTGLYGGRCKNVFASELSLISFDNFYCKVFENTIRIYAAGKTDFNIVPALRQNTNMMLSCIPTNNYRYPLVGVGLIKWTKSNIDKTDLAETLQRQFTNDGTPVISATFNYDTMNLDLKLDTANVDNK
jgi:hypothetical protein